MSLPYMQLWVGDYAADTGHLNAAQHGGYLMLIMHYWAKGSLPTDDGQLARIAKMTAAEWRKNREIVAAFFSDGWRHERVEAELALANGKHNRRVAAGRAGGNARANGKQSSSNATALLKHSSESESEPYLDKKEIRTVAEATRPSDDLFQRFKRGYPRRKGANPWPPARKLFEAAIKSGADPEQIIGALAAGVGFDRDKIGTEYIPQAVKWLRDRRWEDHHPPPTAGPPQAPPGTPTAEELRIKYGQLSVVQSEAGPGEANGIRTNNSEELRPAGALIRPSFRSV